MPPPKADQARLEQVWLACYSAAIAGYRPDLDGFDDRLEEENKDLDLHDKDFCERDELYIGDLMNYAENVADNGVETFVAKFGDGGVKKLRVRSRSDDD
jgi:hypothetical protein